jgi:hypothetical protein
VLDNTEIELLDYSQVPYKEFIKKRFNIIHQICFLSYTGNKEIGKGVLSDGGVLHEIIHLFDRKQQALPNEVAQVQVKINELYKKCLGYYYPV